MHNIQCVSDIHEVVQHVLMHNTGFCRMLHSNTSRHEMKMRTFCYLIVNELSVHVLFFSS